MNMKLWNERDTLIGDDVRRLTDIIDRLEDERIKQHDTIMNYRDEVGFLKKQLAEIKEAGDEFLTGYGYTTKTRRLAEALKEVRGDCLGGCGKIVVYKYPDKDTVLDKLCDECFMKAGVSFPPLGGGNDDKADN